MVDLWWTYRGKVDLWWTYGGLMDFWWTLWTYLRSRSVGLRMAADDEPPATPPSVDVERGVIEVQEPPDVRANVDVRRRRTCVEGPLPAFTSQFGHRLSFLSLLRSTSDNVALASRDAYANFTSQFRRRFWMSLSTSTSGDRVARASRGAYTTLTST